MKLDVYNVKGEKIERIEFDIPMIKLSDFELAQALRVYETNIHQGTKKAKTRGEVAVSKRKPWRQKGTGHARSGTKSSPIWVGGGVAHGPRPYQVRLTLNKKQKSRVFAYLLGKSLQQNKSVVLKVAELKKPIKTSEAKVFLKKVNLLPFKTFYVADINDNVSILGFRNLKNILVRRAQLLNPRDLFRNYNLVITDKALDILRSRIKHND